jgi:hypothetical protein
MWLQNSNKQREDLMMEKKAVQPKKLKSERIRDLDRFVKAKFIRKYQAWGLRKLEEVRRVRKRSWRYGARVWRGLFHTIDLIQYHW